MSLNGSDSPSFLQRCSYWHATLDPALLLASQAEIRKRQQEISEEKDGTEDDKVAAQRLYEVSVHPDTSNITPLLLRPAAYVMMGSPLVVPALMPYKGVMSALIGQISFQAYSTAFTAMNRNLSMQSSPSLSQNPLYLSACALYLACVGATPTYVMKRLGLSSPPAQSFFLRILPPPLFALMGGFSVLLARVSEVDRGIQVLDASGNFIGVSANAGKKAVKETSLSRAALFGITALVPSLVRRSPAMLRHQRLFSIVKFMLAALTFSIMTPVTFGLFPRRGTIAREDLEAELQDKTADLQLFYHRGL